MSQGNHKLRRKPEKSAKKKSTHAGAKKRVSSKTTLRGKLQRTMRSAVESDLAGKIPRADRSRLKIVHASVKPEKK